ncbi:trans-resveratrol di-O-methyltransferase-like [Quercus suber]|nr:trans-resveratrol di-O-methyltransferase-like [Quercus suber]
MSGTRQLSFKLVLEENATELVHAQAHILNHIFNFINSMSLKCAIELGIPYIIHNNGKPMTLSELITVLPIHPTKAHNVYRLMRILINSGFFAGEKISENKQEEVHVLTEPSKLLLKENPLSVTPFLLIMLDPILTTPWHHLLNWFQNDDPSVKKIAHIFHIFLYRDKYGYIAVQRE